jgi:hypothetical protein
VTMRSTVAVDDSGFVILLGKRLPGNVRVMESRTMLNDDGLALGARLSRRSKRMKLWDLRARVA